MASPEYHDDLSLTGRMNETVKGASKGLQHGLSVLFERGKVSSESPPKEVQAMKTKKSMRSSTKELPTFKVHRNSPSAILSGF
jgi:hypothetical protein